MSTMEERWNLYCNHTYKNDLEKHKDPELKQAFYYGAYLLAQSMKDKSPRDYRKLLIDNIKEVSFWLRTESHKYRPLVVSDFFNILRRLGSDMTLLELAGKVGKPVSWVLGILMVRK